MSASFSLELCSKVGNEWDTYQSKNDQVVLNPEFDFTAEFRSDAPSRGKNYQDSKDCR